MNVNPFDRTHIGYDGLFGPKTMFFHWSPEKSSTTVLLVEKLRVPVLDLQTVSAREVEGITVLVVLIGFAWVCWRLLRVVVLWDVGWMMGKGSSGRKEGMKQKKKDK